MKGGRLENPFGFLSLHRHTKQSGGAQGLCLSALWGYRRCDSTKDRVLWGYGGCHTGNGEKLRCSHAESSQAVTSGARKSQSQDAVFKTLSRDLLLQSLSQDLGSFRTCTNYPNLATFQSARSGQSAYLATLSRKSHDLARDTRDSKMSSCM